MATLSLTPFRQSVLATMLATEEPLCASYLARCMQHPAGAQYYRRVAYDFMWELAENGWLEVYHLDRNTACTGSITTFNRSTYITTHVVLSAKGRKATSSLPIDLGTAQWHHPSAGTPCKIPPEAIFPHAIWNIC